MRVRLSTSLPSDPFLLHACPWPSLNSAYFHRYLMRTADLFLGLTKYRATFLDLIALVPARQLANVPLSLIRSGFMARLWRPATNINGCVERLDVPSGVHLVC